LSNYSFVTLKASALLQNPDVGITIRNLKIINTTFARRRYSYRLWVCCSTQIARTLKNVTAICHIRRHN